MDQVSVEVQRLCIRFSRGEQTKYISHLDLMRSWERVLRRAAIPLAYSQGFSPHPRISLAAPLPIGITSDAELMDVFLTRRVSLQFFLQSVKAQLPDGIDVVEVLEVSLGQPSLQARLRAVEYLVKVRTDKQPQQVQDAIAALLAAETLPWQHLRDTGPRHYDLRALVDDIWLDGCEGGACTLDMRLKSGPEGTGRAEQVTAALGFSEHPISIHRTKLHLAERTPIEAHSGKARRNPLERRRTRPGL